MENQFNDNFFDKETFNIVSLFFENAKKYPQKIALIDARRQISFADLAEEVIQTSLYFQKKGIKKGDRVLIFVGMRIDLYRIVLALFNIGAVAVFLDVWVSKKRMEECCKNIDCQAFVGVLKARILSVFSKELRKIPIHLGIYFDKIYPEIPHQQTPTYPQDIALITFTTGSTGTPKGAIRTHQILYAQFRALMDKINPQPNEINMTSLPIMLFINLAGGITSVIPNAKLRRLDLLKPKKIIKQIQQYHINSLIASPFFIKKIAEYVLDNQLNISEITKIFTGGAPIFVQEATCYLQAFPTAHIEVVYGSTEAEPISSILACDIIQNSLEKIDTLQGLSVGKIDKSTTIKIILLGANIQKNKVENRQDFERYFLPAYQVGEIIVSGNHVLQHYFNNDLAEKQNKIWIEGKCWHITGDSGYLDKDNHLFLTGRCDTIIQHNQNFIYPFVYEDILSQIPNIMMATVLKINEKITIFIELKKTFGTKKIKKNNIENQVITAIKASNIFYQDIIFIKKMPRDPRHYTKIDYQKLRNMFYDGFKQTKPRKYKI